MRELKRQGLYALMRLVRMEEFIWWEVMLSQEGGWSTAMTAAGTLCVPVTWVRKELE
jgi:hypothetical protein